jgi:vanillate O-demethylase monooxygenase subunit
MCKSDLTRTAISRFVETFPSVIAEDQWALEKQQRMFDFPDDGYREVFLKPDTALRRARLILTRMERAESGEATAGAAPRRRSRTEKAAARPRAAAE